MKPLPRSVNIPQLPNHSPPIIIPASREAQDNDSFGSPVHRGSLVTLDMELLFKIHKNIRLGAEYVLNITSPPQTGFDVGTRLEFVFNGIEQSSFFLGGGASYSRTDTLYIVLSYK